VPENVPLLLEPPALRGFSMGVRVLMGLCRRQGPVAATWWTWTGSASALRPQTGRRQAGRATKRGAVARQGPDRTAQGRGRPYPLAARRQQADGQADAGRAARAEGVETPQAPPPGNRRNLARNMYQFRDFIIRISERINFRA